MDRLGPDNFSTLLLLIVFLPTYVKVKHREKVLKLRPATVSVTNLAMIFKLETQHGIYIHSEEEAEIILPSESGTFLVEDFSKMKVVNGEPAVSVIPPVNSLSQSPSTSLGLPISYQQPRSKTNPPPGTGRFERPTFKVVKSQGWKKSFVVVEITSSGHGFDKFQVHLNLKEETASVPVIEEMLKDKAEDKGSLSTSHRHDAI